MSLANPGWLFILVPVVFMVILHARGKISRDASLQFSSLEIIRKSGVRHHFFRRIFSALLKLLCLTVLVIALARPQTSEGRTEQNRDVVDIMIAVDISSSMATLDFHPDNRLGAAKTEARRFIGSRPFDRMGLVLFARHAFTQCPLTTDHKALLELLDKVAIGMVEDGTAIGVGLANAVNRLRDSQVKSKIIILLTDGVNNSGSIDPLTAAEIAREFGIRVYTIGIGVDGEAVIPVNDPRYGQTFKRVITEIDEKTLFQIAKATGGIYFRAKDETGLKNVFGEIDELEKTEITIEEYTRHKDYYAQFILWGFAIFILDILFTQVLVVKLP